MSSKQGDCRISHLNKKSEGDVGPGPMGRKLQMNIMKQWRHIFLKYLRYEHIVVVLRCLQARRL